MTGVRDIRLQATAATVLVLAALGTVTYLLPGSGVVAPVQQDVTATAAPAGAGVARPATSAQPNHELHQRFQQAVMMLHAGKYEYAAAALHKVLQLSPRMPEAHVNMGYAMLGLHRHEAARDFFNTAITLQPRQTNAYYGLALALDELCDLPAAIGTMRAFIHLADQNDPFVRKARSALWEWTGEPEVNLWPPRDAGTKLPARNAGACGEAAAVPATEPLGDSTATKSAP